MVGNSSDHSHITVTYSTLSLIATPTSNPVPPTSTANPNPAIHYARFGDLSVYVFEPSDY
jgi:galactan endo-beta-1,3-galactanase